MKTSWSGRLEVLGLEVYDFRLAFQAISKGMWLDNMLAVCRSGHLIDTPSKNVNTLQGNGIIWYDINQKHIVTNSQFRHCGSRTDNTTTIGCSSTDPERGCRTLSTTFGFLSDNNYFTPEIMQATRNISMESCDTLFSLEKSYDSVSGRHVNWMDADGSVSGLHEPTIIGSGVESVKNWWGVDEDGTSPTTYTIMHCSYVVVRFLQSCLPYI
jgi:hypothetical protein